MANKGLIWATDRAEWRLQRLKRRAARAGIFNYRMNVWNGTREMRTKFDGVLVDAPCSGLGTWQRNPQGRWTTTREDVTELATIQRQLLGHAARALKKGGRLVYAVCTLTREETEDVVSSVERGEFPFLKPRALANPLRPSETPSHHLWLHPRDGSNGMFVASWERA